MHFDSDSLAFDMPMDVVADFLGTQQLQDDHTDLDARDIGNDELVA